MNFIPELGNVSQISRIAMLSVYAKLLQVSEKKEPLHEERIRALAKKRGYKSIRALEIAAELPQNNLQKYMNGEATPNSGVLLRLCELLGASPSYLYGRPIDRCKEVLVRTIRNIFGPSEASALELLADMPAERKAHALRILDAFASQAPAPPSRFAIDATSRDEAPVKSLEAKTKKKHL